MKKSYIKKTFESNVNSRNSLDNSINLNQNAQGKENFQRDEKKEKYQNVPLQKSNRNNLGRSVRTNSIPLILIEKIFTKLDSDKNKYITLDDLQKFIKIPSSKLKENNEEEIDLSSLEKKIKEDGKGIDLPEFIKCFREGLKTCNNLINLYKTKLNAINSTIERYLNEINFENLHLVCEYVTAEKNKVSKSNCTNFNDDSLNFKQVIPIYTHKDKIFIQKIGFEFELEKYFVNLFMNDDCEFVKDFNLSSENEKNPQITQLIIRIETTPDTPKQNLEHLYKIKSRFNYYLHKIPEFTSELNKFEEIYFKLNNKPIFNTSQDEEIFLYESIKCVNRIFSLTREEEEVNNMNQSMMESSFISNASRFYSSNLLKSTNYRDRLGSHNNKFMESATTSLKSSLNLEENSHTPLTAKNSSNLNDFEMKYINKTNNNSHNNINYLHNHIHIHNHSHIHKLSISNSHNNDFLSKTPEIKEKDFVDEKIKVLSKIFKSEVNGSEQEKQSEMINKKDEDGNRNKKVIYNQENKTFSILNLLNFATQVNCLFMINNEFDLCKAYHNLVWHSLEEKDNL